MKRIIPVIVIVLAVVIWRSMNNSNVSDSIDVVIDDLMGQAPTSHYALRAVDNSWPDLSEDQQTGLAADILARNYYIVIDASGSMDDSYCSDGRRKIDVAVEALTSFTEQLPPAVNVGLLVFDDNGISERMSLSQFDRNRYNQALATVRVGSGTPLRTAITDAFGHLETQAMTQLGYGEYHLVVVTDGEANDGQDPRNVVSMISDSSPVLIHTIGFCIEGGHSLNQPQLVDYKQANDPASLAESLQQVLAEAPDFNVADFEEEG